MKLELIKVKNFKGLKDQELSPSMFTCLVGENNAGKSTAMQAIVFALNRPRQMPTSHFYDLTKPISFELSISGVDDAHLARLAPEARTKIASIVIEGMLNLRVEYAPGETVTVYTKRKLPADPRYHSDAIDEAFKDKRGQESIEAAAWQNFPEFQKACNISLRTVGAARSFIKEQVELLPEESFSFVDTPLPSGISPSITPLLPEPIYIPAVKNFSDDLRTSQSTSFGRLLGLLLDDMSADLAPINSSLEQLNVLLNTSEVDGQLVDKRHEKVKGLEEQVESLLGENFPNVKVHLKIPPPELKTILNTAQIFINDGANDHIENKGDGIKRSLTFALLQAFVNRQDSAANDRESITRPLIFLFEEPELYLHPRSQRVLFNTLARISRQYQVLLTTHSPIFFAPGVTASFIRVARQPAAPKPVTKLFPVNFELNKEDAETFRLARFENADAAFFSQSIVLFEGESDDAYCKHVAKLLNDEWDFDRKNIALIRVSGKGNFLKFRRFYESFGIAVQLVADLDALFEGFHHLGANQLAQELRGKALQTIDARIEALDIRAEPNSRQIQRRVHQDSWKVRYEAAKNALQAVQQGAEVNAQTFTALEGLFVWEKDIARQRVCIEDEQAAASLVPLLDCLRAQGICVLSKGAIEDYYPADCPSSGPKPDRALAACAALTVRDQAKVLSKPLQEGRVSELEQIFETLFKQTESRETKAATGTNQSYFLDVNIAEQALSS